MASSPDPKKRKIDPSSSSTTTSTSTRRNPLETFKSEKVASSSFVSSVRIPGENVGKVDQKVMQAKKFAVAQAQQERCLGSYRSFDSPFGNYLLPVIPTHSDLFK